MNNAGNLEDAILDYVERLRKGLDQIRPSEIQSLVQHLLDTRKNGTKVLIAGNGGSASTSNHFALDWMLGTGIDNPSLRVISLSESAASVTATGNDIDFQSVFSRQIRHLGAEGDLLVLVSASGNSPNLLAAGESAKSMGMTVFSIVGFDGGKLKLLSDSFIHVPTLVHDYGVAEDIHLAIGHIVKEALIVGYGND